MATFNRIVPCLWFNDQAERAALYYVSTFESGSRIKRISRYTDVGKEHHGHEAGTVMTVEFELGEQPFTALNGGPEFKFNEAVSLQVSCDTQAEIDHYWERLSAGGDPTAQVCGWLKDQFGVSWQIVPSVLSEMTSDHDVAKVERVTRAFFTMKKMDIVELQRAFAG